MNSSLVCKYMFAKYTSWCPFLKAIAPSYNARDWKLVHEVVNASKNHKLSEVASRHEIKVKDFRELAISFDAFGLYDHESQVIRKGTRHVCLHGCLLLRFFDIYGSSVC